MQCRFCGTRLEHVFIDLGNSPPSNSFLNKEQLNEPEVFYPLKVFTCHNCFLVQIDEYKKSGEIFNNLYAYFSSYSSSWLRHASNYADMMVDRFGFNENSRVVEVASNDGYLLQYFLQKQIPVLGIEPTKNTAAVAIEKGIETVIDFFGVSLATQLAKNEQRADLLLGNNVLAHVPDINDFVAGLKILLNSSGIVTMEFPHLMQLVDNSQFDTIYHEHFSYLSLYTVKQIFNKHELEIFDVEELPTHGGSLRIFVKHADNNEQPESKNVENLLAKEKKRGMKELHYYKGFKKKVEDVKMGLLQFIVSEKSKGKSIAAYGAAAKGNTLLNFCGIRNDFIDFVIDANPHKQNKFLPASHIPVLNEEHLKKERPDYVLILPWNLKEEIMHQLDYIRQWNGKFVIPIPELQIIL